MRLGEKKEREKKIKNGLMKLKQKQTHEQKINTAGIIFIQPSIFEQKLSCFWYYDYEKSTDFIIALRIITADESKNNTLSI